MVAEEKMGVLWPRQNNEQNSGCHDATGAEEKQIVGQHGTEKIKWVYMYIYSTKERRDTEGMEIKNNEVERGK